MGSVQDFDHEPDWLAIHDTIEGEASKRVKLCVLFVGNVTRESQDSPVRQDKQDELTATASRRSTSYSSPTPLKLSRAP